MTPIKERKVELTSTVKKKINNKVGPIVVKKPPAVEVDSSQFKRPAPLVQRDSPLGSESEPETLVGDSARNRSKLPSTHSSTFKFKLPTKPTTVAVVSLTERQTPEKPLAKSQSNSIFQVPKWVRLNEHGKVRLPSLERSNSVQLLPKKQRPLWGLPSIGLKPNPAQEKPHKLPLRKVIPPKWADKSASRRLSADLHSVVV